MATFSTNSVRHLYVANASSGATAGCFGGAYKTAENELYLTFYNSLNKLYKTDLIPISQIRSVSVKPYAPKILKKDAISFSAPIVGETYIIRFVLRQWGSGSAENQYFKHVGAYKAKTGDDAEDMVDAFIANAAKNFAREPFPMFTFSKENTGANCKLIVTEYEMPWVLGKQQGRPLDYSIQFVKINNSGVEDYEWGTVTNRFKPYAGVGTNHISRDMEYFYLGERGDVYRNVGYPFTFDTTYLADTTANYSVIDIQYYTKGIGMNSSPESEKTLTIIAKEASAAGSRYDIVNAIISAVNTATGVTTLPTGNTTNPTNVILFTGSLGVAAATSITTLTTATKYVIYTNPGTTSEVKGYVKADGTVSTTEADIANLSGTAITGLTAGTTYFVKVY